MYAFVQALKRWRHYLFPKEFVVYTDNQALSLLNSQDKLSHRNIKWMKYLQAYTFTIKHKKGISNKVVDALSRRNLIVSQIKLESVGIEALKDMYVADLDFGNSYKVCMEFGERYHANFPNLLVQYILLLKGGQLCVPKCSMRTNIIKEKHS